MLCACRRRRCVTRSSWWRTCWPASARTSSLWLSCRHGRSPRASTRCAWRSTCPTRTLRSALVVVGENEPDVSVQLPFDALLVPVGCLMQWVHQLPAWFKTSVQLSVVVQNKLISIFWSQIEAHWFTLYCSPKVWSGALKAQFWKFHRVLE